MIRLTIRNIQTEKNRFLLDSEYKEGVEESTFATYLRAVNDASPGAGLLSAMK